jgi:thymidine phosphorylase
VPAPRPGFVTAIDTRAIGLAVVALGGGRTAPGQAIDPAVGLDRLIPRGARLQSGEPLARVHARTDEAGQEAVQAVVRAYSLGDGAPPPPPPLIERIQ